MRCNQIDELGTAEDEGSGLTMIRALPLAIVSAVALLLVSATMATHAGSYGTADEARAMLNRAVAAVKNDKAKALAMFNRGDKGFKDRDLYVLCANASDGTITASPSSNGKNLRDSPPGRKVMQTATEGKVDEVTYRWPRPGTITPLKKHTFYTKVGDQICGVGYWE
jgi:hypothetical protein